MRIYYSETSTVSVLITFEVSKTNILSISITFQQFAHCWIFWQFVIKVFSNVLIKRTISSTTDPNCCMFHSGIIWRFDSSYFAFHNIIPIFLIRCLGIFQKPTEADRKHLLCYMKPYLFSIYLFPAFTIFIPNRDFQRKIL